MTSYSMIVPRVPETYRGAIFCLRCRYILVN